MPGVSVREIGECDRSDAPEEAFTEDRRWLCMLNGGVPKSGAVAGRPLVSYGGCEYQLSTAARQMSSAVKLTFFFGACPADFTRFRLLITSVFRLIGRARPCSFRNRPQALQSTEPASSLLHSGVVEVWQFWQTGCVKGEVWSVRDAAIAICSTKVAGVDEDR